MVKRSTRTSRSLQSTRAERRNRELARAHRRWTKGEEGQLTKEFHAGMVLEEMAKTHLRTSAAIQSRLTKLGLGQARRSTRTDEKLSPSAPTPRSNAPASVSSRSDVRQRPVQRPATVPLISVPKRTGVLARMFRRAK